MIEIKVLTKNNCRYCGPTKLFLSEQETVLTNVNIEYTNIDTVLPEVRETIIDKYRMQQAPLIVFLRNGHEMARTSGPTAIEEFEDALEYARTAK
jgi:glutaredoxin